MNPRIIDFTQIRLEKGIYGPVFAVESDDLDCNLIYWDEGEGVPAHPNDDLDVVGIVLQGEGILHIDGVDYKLRAGQFFFIPKRAVRALRSAGSDLIYLTVHQRREPLMPD
jgi:mannose-6-phosphate isomerase-like protein (cupin superfamily)